MTAVDRALIEAVLLGVVGGMISVQIVLRRLPFFTLAMTHATFPGVVLAAVAGIDLYAGGGLFGVLIVLGVLALSRRPAQAMSTAIGIVLSAGFALGVVLASTRDGFSKDLTAYTVGQILTVGTGDLIAVTVAGAIVAALLLGAGRQLTFRAFDPGGYAAAGYRPVLTDLALLLTIEAVIVVSVPAAGAILSVAVLVGPAAIARLWTHNIPAMTAIAVTAGASSGLIGVHLSTRYDVAAGGTITLVTGTLFVLSLATTTAWSAMASHHRRSRPPAHQTPPKPAPAR
ncbi:metal ABC transporter permease [Actinomadura sp. 3N508]|uniref:metal ABC transporter permease n=1 Tax=Actinomadura sp. 3N508 TaxID=3375153 RepID=UPI003793FA9A